MVTGKIDLKRSVKRKMKKAGSENINEQSKK